MVLLRGAQNLGWLLNGLILIFVLFLFSFLSFLQPQGSKGGLDPASTVSLCVFNACTCDSNCLLMAWYVLEKNNTAEEIRCIFDDI